MTDFLPPLPEIAADSADPRLQALASWLLTQPQTASAQLRPASGDASFRRYFRLHHADGTLIAMDAPPERENVDAFVRIQRLLADAGLRVPHIHACDSQQGFMLLQDLGMTSYLDALQDDNAAILYAAALDSIAQMQSRITALDTLPCYDEALLRREIGVFGEWCLERWLGLTDIRQNAALERTWTLLTDSALEQPRVFVHRDFHSRNLMISPDGAPGILDFQDAVAGPLTYDLVSLLRDCYIAWPEQAVTHQAMQFQQRLVCQGVIRDDWPLFQRWMDWMGVQRHLKAAGIFCRLSLRDGKQGYLGDIPRTLDYIVAVCRRYPELQALETLLEQRVAPHFERYRP